MRPRFGSALLAAFVLASACTTPRSTAPGTAPAAAAPVDLPDELLQDVNIAILDPGIDNLDPKRATTTPGIRRAESHYIAQRMKDTLERSRQWGAVRVVPAAGRDIDVAVTGKILESDGESLKLEISVDDATGRHWFTRNYGDKVTLYTYDAEIRRQQDPFQPVYDRIAQDMQDYLRTLDRKALSGIRWTSELRFAQRFAPQAYGDYLSVDDGGVHVIKRLPADGDPVMQRIRRIRVRDQMYVDHLQDYYRDFDQAMAQPYDSWREESYAESEQLHSLESEAIASTIGGALAVLGGILAQASGSSMARTAGIAGIAGGAYLFKSGLDKNAEARIHTAALKELSESLNAEVQPQTIALGERTVELNGTIDEQYREWQSLLQQIYALETGQTASPDTR